MFTASDMLVVNKLLQRTKMEYSTGFKYYYSEVTFMVCWHRACKN